ncbi:M14 family zinc carboxypeptidase [Cytobacillus gottheilii]|uniref:M14 family zinc carboxypeptidase n=1 Tax=Cytobacillus gottheilii TaxID=859144 RepID=UPI0009BB4CF8|nr:M14 family zinc carboxypeptidase [Cytobacillus gottheilii]
MKKTVAALIFGGFISIASFAHAEEVNIHEINTKEESSQVDANQNLQETSQIGWVEIDGDWYYYIENVKSKGLLELEEGVYYLHPETGERQSGWVEFAEGWSYFSYETGARQTAWVTDQGKQYYLNDNGIMLSNGWYFIEETWYFFDKSGAMKKGWIKDRNRWYYLMSSGKMATGWVYDQYKWYYMNQSGAMVTGWVNEAGQWYFMDSSGAMKKGWLIDQNKWYYLMSSGKMATGWVYDQYKWYYMNQSGAMVTGWINEAGQWYFMDSSGAMKKGWLKDQNKWYYLMQSGKMATGWVKVGYHWYYLNNSGAMLTGWYTVDGEWYYSFGSGAMAANTKIGSYYVGYSGKWLPDIVNPKTVYTYEQMVTDINEFKNTYPDFIHTEVIGKSVDGRDIIAVKLGKGKREIFLNGSHHAREHLTTNLLMEMLDQYAAAYADNRPFAGYYTGSILNQTSIWFVPMVNPDGVTLVQKGHKSAKNPNYVLALNNYNTDFSGWKANIRGVDLNRQYPADWENIKGNPGVPSTQNFKGYSPLSEPEAKAIYDFTLAHDFKTAVAYHSSGEILYWYFNQKGYEYTRDYALAAKYGGLTSYSLVRATPNPSGGGYTDWFVQDIKLPGFTPEISPYTYGKPVPVKNFDKIWQQNKAAGLMLAKESEKY